MIATETSAFNHQSNLNCIFKYFKAFKQIKLSIMLQSWDMLVFVALLRKKEILLLSTLARRVEKNGYKTKIFSYSMASF